MRICIFTNCDRKHRAKGYCAVHYNQIQQQGFVAPIPIVPKKRTYNGYSDSDTNYSRWKSIKKRCYNSNVKQYKNYGGRGIRMDKIWVNDFRAFSEYINNLPHSGEPGYSIDRIDNDGNYEPGNLRWATSKQQNNNRTTTRLFTIGDKTLSIKQWAEQFGLNYETVYYRINKGSSILTALEII